MEDKTKENEIFEELDKNSLKTAKNFISDSNLKDLIFFGGALVKNKLRTDKAIDDYDFMLIGTEENKKRFNLAVERLKKTGYEIIGKHEETTTNLAMRQFKKDGKVFELCLKKDLMNKNTFGTFDIDNLSVEFNIDTMQINNFEAIQSLKDKTLQLKEETKNVFRILGRILVHIAKYDIEIFHFNKEQTLSFITNPTERELTSNRDSLLTFIGIPEQAKAECLAKFFFMMSRVDNVGEYVEKINNSGLLDGYFPKLSKILKDEKFLESLSIESQKKSEERTLNNDLLVFNKVYQYCKKEDIVDFIKECEILKLTRSTKESQIIQELEKLNDNKTLIRQY